MAHPQNSGSAINIFFKNLHNDGGQQVDENSINDFSQKTLVWGKWTILGPRWCIIITLDQLQDFFKNFAPVADRYTKIILMAVLKKILFGANGSFRTQNCASSQLWICRKNYFTILHNERGQERHGNYITGVFEKCLIRGSLVILTQKRYIRPQNFRSQNFFLYNI